MPKTDNPHGSQVVLDGEEHEVTANHKLSCFVFGVGVFLGRLLLFDSDVVNLLVNLSERSFGDCNFVHINLPNDCQARWSGELGHDEWRLRALMTKRLLMDWTRSR